ncbi:hypothetical protein L209DRAFT_759336 [Thermothelomyces heterothallicus CBS 203.75]
MVIYLYASVLILTYRTAAYRTDAHTCLTHTIPASKFPSARALNYLSWASGVKFDFGFYRRATQSLDASGSGAVSSAAEELAMRLVSASK